MPTGENWRRQRASSPSEQSRSTCRLMSRTAASAVRIPGMASMTAATTPTRIISHVTAFGVSRVGTSRCVRYGDARRMYRRPDQCSPLLRAKMDGGCVTARSSAIDGLGEGADTACHLPAVEVEVLEDREAVRPRGGRLQDRLGEPVVVEAEVGVGAGEA